MAFAMLISVSYWNSIRAMGKIATLTAVMLEQTKGVLNIGGDNAVKSFREKKYIRWSSYKCRVHGLKFGDF